MVVVEQILVAHRVGDLPERGHRGGTVRRRQRERDVGAPGTPSRHVLHDHVDVDPGLGELAEDRRGLARLVGHADHGDLHFAPVVRDAGDDGLFHG